MGNERIQPTGPNQPPRKYPTLETFIQAHREIPRESIALAPPQILDLIGGVANRGLAMNSLVASELGLGTIPANPTSNGGIEIQNISKGVAPSDSLDDTGLITIPLDRIAVPMNALAGLTNAITAGEQVADGNFVFALAVAQEMLAQRKIRGEETAVLFIQGKINITDDTTYTRLQRLAQSLGVAVGVTIYERDTFHRDTTGVKDYDSSSLIQPPTAQTIEAYWQQLAESKKYHEPETPTEHITDPAYYADVIDLLTIVAPEGNWYNATGKAEKAWQIYSGASRTLYEKLLHMYALSDQERAVTLEHIGKEQLFASLQTRLTHDLVQGKDMVFGLTLDILAKVAPVDALQNKIALLQTLEHIPEMKRKKTLLETIDGSGALWTLVSSIQRDIRQDSLPLAMQEQKVLIPLLQKVAKRNNPNDTDNAKIDAREILATLGDTDTLHVLLAEASNTKEVERARITIGEPLAIYLAKDAQLTNDVITHVNSLLQAHTYGHEINRLIPALLYSGRPEVATLITQLLTTEANNKQYSDAIALPLFLDLQVYIEALQAFPESMQKQHALIELAHTLETFLGEIQAIPPDPDLRYKMPFSNVAETITTALIGIGSETSRQLVRQEVLNLFSKGGYILADTTFQKAYLAYRERYGSIPEIDRCITLIS